MFGIQTVCIILELTAVCMLTGYGISRVVVRQELSLIECISEGFVWILTIFFLLALPFLFFRLPFHILYYLFGIVVLFGIAVGGIVLYQKRERVQFFSHPPKIFFWIVVLFILFQAFGSTYLYHEDDDDGYYIAVSNLAVDKDMVETDARFVYDGCYREELGTGFTPPIVSWELLLACVAKFNRIKPVVLCHSILPLWLIVMSYIVVWRLGKAIFNGYSEQIIFMFFYCIVNMFGGFLVRQQACFLLLRIWQGKAILACIIFPLLIENYTKIYKGKQDGYWLRGCVILLSGTMCSSVGLMLTPMCYVAYGMPLLLQRVNERKTLIRMFPSILLSITPSVILGIGSLYYVMTRESGIAYSQQTPETWDVWRQVTMGTLKTGYLIWIVFSCVVLFYLGEKWEKTCLVGGTVVAMLTFLNPLLSDIVGQKITGTGVYWRIWWIIPAYTIISAGFTHLLVKIDNLYVKGIVACSLTVVLALSGEFMYQKNLYFTEYQNVYKLPEDMISVCDTLLTRQEQITVLPPADWGRKIRQYSIEFVVPAASNMYMLDIEVPKTDMTYKELYDAIYNEHTVDNMTYNALVSLNIDYILIRDEIKDMKPIEHIGEVYVYSVKQNVIGY